MNELEQEQHQSRNWIQCSYMKRKGSQKEFQTYVQSYLVQNSHVCSLQRSQKLHLMRSHPQKWQFTQVDYEIWVAIKICFICSTINNLDRPGYVNVIPVAVALDCVLY